MNKEVKIVVGIAAVVIIGGALLLLNTPKSQEKSIPAGEKSLVRETSRMTGKFGAKVTLVEFGDYQCPACAAADTVVEQMISDYKDNPDFNFVFRHFPLPMHKNARIAAQAAQAAGEQNKYWEMHALLYQKQSEWAESLHPIEVFENYAQILNMDVPKFKAAILDEKFANVITTDQSDGEAFRVNATPTYFLNGEQVGFERGFGELRLKVDAALKK